MHCFPVRRHGNWRNRKRRWKNRNTSTLLFSGTLESTLDSYVLAYFRFVRFYLFSGGVFCSFHNHFEFCSALAACHDESYIGWSETRLLTAWLHQNTIQIIKQAHLYSTDLWCRLNASWNRMQSISNWQNVFLAESVHTVYCREASRERISGKKWDHSLLCCFAFVNGPLCVAISILSLQTVKFAFWRVSYLQTFSRLNVEFYGRKLLAWF